ncbi:hypothetical protein EV182_002003, partial [Spiromyces aspiralis]
MFREIPLSRGQQRLVIDKVARLLENLDLNEVPPLIYQLLLFVRKNDKCLVLDPIISFFSRLEDKVHNGRS